MSKTLTEYLEIIGLELHDNAYMDDSGTIRPITKDEQLSREIWKRALGYEERITNSDGSIAHRVFSPDPRAQQFIFERREGKAVEPRDDHSITLLDKISDIARLRINAAAEKSIDAADDDTTFGS